MSPKRDRSAPEGEERVQLNVVIPKRLKEKLNAVCAWEGITKMEFVQEALFEHIERLEAERGEPYEVLPFHRED